MATNMQEISMEMLMGTIFAGPGERQCRRRQIEDALDFEPHAVDARRHRLMFWLLLSAAAGAFLFSCTVGRFQIPLHVWVDLFLRRDSADVSQLVLLGIRLPRVLAACLIGAAVSVSGASFQGMFRNPMVSPDILGTTAGAASGAAVAILLNMPPGIIELAAFLGALLAVLLTCGVSAQLTSMGNSMLSLILTGMIVTSIFTAITSLLKTIADPENKLPTLTYWLMGSLSSVTPKQALTLTVLFPVGFVPLYLLRWRMNALTLSDEDAKSLGVHPVAMRVAVILCSTVLTAASVAIAGPVAWVGLTIPHLVRLLIGPNFRYLIPATALTGALYLLLVDDIARLATSTEIPLGILTALVGAPVFLYLLWQNNRAEA